MASPVVTSTTPVDSAVNVNITAPIVVTFSTNILASSIVKGTFTVFRYDALEEVEGSYAISGSTVTFLPARSLYEDKVYSVVLVGSADNNPAGYIKSTDGDGLVDSYAFSFRTHVEQYATLEAVEERADVTQDGPIRVEDITAAGGLELMSVSPPGFSTDLANSLTGVVFTFSESIDGTTVVQGTTVFMETYPVLGIEEYYGDVMGTSDPVLYECASDEMKATEFVQPTGYFEVDGDTLTWHRGTGEPGFNYNTEIMFRLTQGIRDINGHYLISEIQSTMTSTYFPKLMSSHMMRIRCGPMLADQYDDVLNRTLHKNSIEAWEQAAYGFDLHKPIPAARRWVYAKSTVDIANMISARAQVLAGQTKWLGDLRIEYPNVPQPRVDYGIIKEAKDELALLTPELRSYRHQTLPMVAIKGRFAGDADAARRSRRWAIEYEYGSTFYNMSNFLLPASNLNSMRIKKLGLAHGAHDHIDYRQTTFYHGAGTDGQGLFVCPTST